MVLQQIFFRARVRESSACAHGNLALQQQIGFPSFSLSLQKYHIPFLLLLVLQTPECLEKLVPAEVEVLEELEYPESERIKVFHNLEHELDSEQGPVQVERCLCTGHACVKMKT